jgi:hypothetical protein
MSRAGGRWLIHPGTLPRVQTGVGRAHRGQVDERMPRSQSAPTRAGDAVKATTGARSLKTFPVELRDGAIWLTG